MRMFDVVDSQLKSRRSAQLMRIRSFWARHGWDGAMLLCVTGWSLIWADALSLVVLPMWIPVVCFYAGLALIPFLRRRDTP
jgi:hypothetical protein